MSTEKFSAACVTYRYLLENGYPEKASLKLVADKHRLTRTERNCIFRGVVIPRKAGERRAKIAGAGDIAGERVGVDWYNVLITVESYLKGQTVFLCEDGVLRDSAGVHGSYHVTELTTRARDAILACVTALGPSRLDLYVDMPVAHSGLMAAELRSSLASASCQSSVELAHSADYPLKSYPGIVASSDSVVLDAATRVFDLARHVLSDEFHFTPEELHNLFP